MAPNANMVRAFFIDFNAGVLIHKAKLKTATVSKCTFNLKQLVNEQECCSCQKSHSFLRQVLKEPFISSSSPKTIKKNIQ